jgi:hypothetical protein
MDIYDDELRKFEAEGAAPLPVPDDQGYIENQGSEKTRALKPRVLGSGIPLTGPVRP